MIILADRDTAARLRQEKQDYIDRYNRDKLAYDAYATNVLNSIKEKLAKEIAAFNESSLSINFEHNSRNEYCVGFSYRSNKRGDMHRHYRSSHDFRTGSQYIDTPYGISWSVCIYIDSSGQVLNNPSIRCDMMEADDLDVLAATYNLFKAISTIDWKSILENAQSESPDLSEFTVNRKGELDTSSYDNKIASNLDILRKCKGKDLWVGVLINDHFEWIRVISFADKSIVINRVDGNAGYLSGNAESPVKLHGNEDRFLYPSFGSYASVTKEQIMDTKVRLYKERIKIAQPETVLSSDELFEIYDSHWR